MRIIKCKDRNPTELGTYKTKLEHGFRDLIYYPHMGGWCDKFDIVRYPDYWYEKILINDLPIETKQALLKLLNTTKELI